MGFCLFSKKELNVGWVEKETGLDRLGGGEEYDKNICKFKNWFK